MYSILSVSSKLDLFFVSRTLCERGLSKNICLTSHKSLPGDVLCRLPGGSIRLSEGEEALLHEDLSSATCSNLSGQDNPLLD